MDGIIRSLAIIFVGGFFAAQGMGYVAFFGDDVAVYSSDMEGLKEAGQKNRMAMENMTKNQNWKVATIGIILFFTGGIVMIAEMKGGRGSKEFTDWLWDYTLGGVLNLEIPGIIGTAFIIWCFWS